MKCNEHLAKIGSICCQKIIPLVFDQSYSYYEQLCGFATKLNEIICAVNEQNLTIADFENRLNRAFQQYKSEINLAFADFQIEVNEKIEEFTTEIRDEWRIYRETLNLEFRELKNANAQFKTDMQTAWSTYQAQINSTINNFMTAETTARTNFETAQTTRQENFETSMTNDWTAFQTEIESELASVSNKDRLSYYGALRPVSAGSSTDWPFIDNPIDSVQGLNFANNLVSVYTYNATTHKYNFLKRQKYGVLATDSDIPTPTRNAPLLIIFDNPVANLFFAYGSELTFSGTPTESGITRLVVGAFPRIADTMEVDTTQGYVPLAEYHASGQGVQDLQPYTTPYPVQPSYYAIAFILFGVGVDITVTQPTTAATQRRIMPGLLYDAFTGDFMRDPALADFVANVLPYILQRGEYTLNDQSVLTFDTLTDTKYYRYTASAIGNPVPGGYGIVVNIRFTAYAVQLAFSQTTAAAPTQLLYRIGTDMTTTPAWKTWQTVGSGGGATVKTLTYTGTGTNTNTNTIVFPDTPKVILSIDGMGLQNGYVSLSTFRFGSKAVSGVYVNTESSMSGEIRLKATATGNTLTLSMGADAGSVCNANGETYTVTYI